MTNLTPQPPENNDPQNRRPVLTFDEMIGIIVAFTAIGAILLWSLISKNESNPIAQSDNTFLSFGSDREDREATTTEDETIFNRILSQADAEDTADSSYLARQPETELSTSTADTAALFSQPDDENFQLDTQARLVPTPIPLGSILEPEVLQSPQFETPPAITIPENETFETPEAETPAPSVAETPEAEAPETETPAPSVAETPETETPEIGFGDVSQDYWAYPFIAKLAERELVLGSSENLFEPNKLITRASMATMVSMAFNQPETQATKSFTDVSEENTIATDINKTVSMNFMQGYSDEEFRPLENIPRYQVLVALATGLGLKPSQDVNTTLQGFEDSDRLPDWSREQVAAAIESGLLVNRPDFASNALNPEQSANRAEVAAMIHQALVQTGKLEATDSEYIVRPQS